MQYTVSINQYAAIASGFDLDLVDLALFDFVSRYAHAPEVARLVEDGKVYYWVAYAKIIEEMPLLGLKTKDAVYRRIRNLIRAGVFEEYGRNREIGKTYFAFGANYRKLGFTEIPAKGKGGYGWTSDPSDEKPTHRTENRRGTDENPEGGTDEKSDNQYTNIDQVSKDIYSEREEKNETPDKSEPSDDSMEDDKQEKDEDPEFSRFWSLYPRKDDKKQTRVRFLGLSKKDRAAAFAGLPAWVAYWHACKTEPQFISLPSTWISKRRWEDESPTIPPKTTSMRRNRPANALGNDAKQYVAGAEALGIKVLNE